MDQTPFLCIQLFFLCSAWVLSSWDTFDLQSCSMLLNSPLSALLFYHLLFILYISFSFLVVFTSSIPRTLFLFYPTFLPLFFFIHISSIYKLKGKSFLPTCVFFPPLYIILFFLFPSTVMSLFPLSSLLPRQGTWLSPLLKSCQKLNRQNRAVLTAIIFFSLIFFAFILLFVFSRLLVNRYPFFFSSFTLEWRKE